MPYNKGEGGKCPLLPSPADGHASHKKVLSGKAGTFLFCQIHMNKFFFGKILMRSNSYDVFF
jgi:hypothetical protein